jgi:RimJ/RimL family protein N-acetyltransferase
VPLYIGVEKDNPNARRLYERLGLVEVGVTDDDYRLSWEP